MDPFPSVLLNLAWLQARVSDKASRDYKEVLNSEIEIRSWALHSSCPGWPLMHSALTPGLLALKHHEDFKQPTWWSWRKPGQDLLSPPSMPRSLRNTGLLQHGQMCGHSLCQGKTQLLFPRLLSPHLAHRLTPDSTRTTLAPNHRPNPGPGPRLTPTTADPDSDSTLTPYVINQSGILTRNCGCSVLGASWRHRAKVIFSVLLALNMGHCMSRNDAGDADSGGNAGKDNVEKMERALV